MAYDSDHPFAPVVKLWQSLLKKARDHKWRAFGQTADECWRFFDGAHDFMYKNAIDSVGMSAESAPKTTFRMTMNKVAELVQLFGPTMYYKNPHRQVGARKPDIPQVALDMMAQEQASAAVQQQAMMAGSMMGAPAFMDQNLMQQQQAMIAQQIAMGFQQQMSSNAARDEAVANLMQWVLNFTPNEFDLKRESRMAIDEALIKGRGVMLHEMYKPPGSSTWLPRSSWVSVDDLLIDPDARTLREAKWVAIRCQEPHWQIERDRGLEEDSLKHAADYGSATKGADVESRKYGTHYRNKGETHDLVTYYKIWSKAGVGHRLSIGDKSYIADDISVVEDAFGEFGDYSYMEVCDGCDYPLNLPPELMDAPAEDPNAMMEVQARLQWPVPFYLDGEWPITELDFHVVPGCPWPQAHMKPALGELRFLNWAMSFLAGRIMVTSRTFIAVAEDLDDSVKDAIEDGGDLTILPFKRLMNKNIGEVVQFLDHPQVNADIWRIIEAVMVIFDKRVGLTDLVYGLSGRQMRSAQEAQVKEERTSVRPDDMAEQVETWQTRMARKEGIMLRLFCPPDSVAPQFGEQVAMNSPMPGVPPTPQYGPLTQLWAKHVFRPPSMGPEAMDFVFREYEYRIEAGSIRKPNVERDQTNMDQAMNVLFQPVHAMYTATGNPQAVNALISAWAKTRQLDATQFLFPPFQPAPPPQQQQAQAPPQQGSAA